MPFVKLDCGILRSTIWDLDAETCKVWITLLAMAGPSGLVECNSPGVAHEARLPVEKAEACLEKLAQPDPRSRTKDSDGRRIERTDEGFLILNYGKYRDKDYSTPRVKKHRAGVSERSTPLHGVSERSSVLPYAYASASESVPSGKGGLEGGEDPPEDLQPGMTGMSPNVDAVWIAKRWHTLAPKGTCALDKASHQFARGLLVGIDKHDLMKAVESNQGRLPHEIVDALKPKMAKPAKRKITTEEIAAGVEKLLNDKEAFKRATE